MVAQRAETRPSQGTLVAGVIPPLADPYFERAESGPGLASSLFPGQTAVLTHGADTETAPTAQGGTGKTQLAVEFARMLWSTRAVDVLVWVPAGTREAVVAGFAQAAGRGGADDPDADALAAASRFAAWLARTERRWALVLDDVTDPAALAGLWPSGRGGRTVITTRLPGTAFSGAALGGAHAAPNGLRVIPVGGFSRREALSYLSAGLTDYADQRIEALDLGEDLDGLPIALAQAAAVINAGRLSCQEYRASPERAAGPHGRAAGRRGSPAVLATWSLAAQCADQLAPAGLASPALALTAVLDPDGIPGAVLDQPGGMRLHRRTAEQRGQRGPDHGPGRDQQPGPGRLVTIDPANPVRTVRINTCIQTAVRASCPPPTPTRCIVAAADALVQAWPETGRGRDSGAGISSRPCATAP